MLNLFNGMTLLTQTPEIAEKKFTVEGPLVVGSFDLFGLTINFTEVIIVEFIVITVFAVLFFILGRNLKERPDSIRQIIAEYIVSFFAGTVKDTMGPSYSKYTPYIGALFCMSLLSSLMGLFGLKAPTSDLSVVAAWGIITFILVERNKLKSGGIRWFAKSLTEPVKFMLPFNIISEFANPVSQTLRHFANILAGGVIGGLLYFALGNFAIGIPAALSLYFDLFSSVIQAYIFIMLTMSYVAMAEE